MISGFFINRPVFAGVLAIVMTLAGALSATVLPVEQYPQVTPPTVQVATVYPGASAKTVEESVASPLEQEVNGVEDMIYMSSNSSDNGQYTLTVTFRVGTDLDLAAVRVQNRVAVAEARLPEEVRRQGVTTTKQSTSLLLVATPFSPDGRYDQLFLSNYATLYIRDSLSRVPGVGAVQVFGAKDFAMRVWLNPDKLAARGLTTVDALTALREQNVQVAGGRLGQEPIDDGSGLQLTINAQGRLETVEQFGDIILKVGEEQRTVRLRDVAGIELGAQDYDSFARLNGAPGPAMGIYQLPGTNALEVAEGVRAALDDLATDFPEGFEIQVTYDFTRFVSASIQEVIVTLLIASTLVFVTVFVFLQDWRATLIPGAAIPVSIVGAFAIMLAIGFSINMLTLLALVLAIGIVVDDAIVVVENTARIIEEDGLDSKAAAKQSMMEITGPVVATTLVLLAVFVPTSLLPGITGELFRQFGVTLSVATVLSSVNALTLSPALCGILLRKPPERRFIAFRWFNNALDAGRSSYLWSVRQALRASVVAVVLFAAIVAGVIFSSRFVPGGFLPEEDQSVVFVNIQLPDAAKLARTEEVLSRVDGAVSQVPGVDDTIAIGGRSLISGVSQSNVATLIATLDPWGQRETRPLSVPGIMGEIQHRVGGMPEAVVFPFRPPALQGVGMAGGFDMRVQDRSAAGPAALEQAAGRIIERAMDDARIADAFTGFRATAPQLYVDIDRTKLRRLGVPFPVAFNTLQTNMGGVYVNDFNIFGRVYQVRAQADAEFRNEVDDILRLEVRNIQGETLPMGTIATVRNTVGPATLYRYNLFPAAQISGTPRPDVSAEEAAQIMEDIATETLDPGMGYEWTGMSYQQMQAGNLAPIVFSLAVLFAYLFLAAQYESFITPVTILATAPVGVLGALLALMARGIDVNIYTQIGIVLLIALVSKNAILIVEFAELRRRDGEDLRDAALEAARLRFRPILMTAFAFILGTVPLLLATGAGANGRMSIGTAVFGGMLLATIVGLFLIPTLYLAVRAATALLGGGARRAS